jgi:hypothetical protein
MPADAEAADAGATPTTGAAPPSTAATARAAIRYGVPFLPRW